jgi:crotonobetainyl-CoA:carnitine CoA-transferase CaiB-like acyl-CoA transferase
MTSVSRDKLPLRNVKVLDFGQYVAGPAVAMMLGDLGATVVHVDPPGGPMWKSPANATLNRNKLIVSLDLKSEEGLARARELVAEADILIENFRPGKMAALGLDPAELRHLYPELITVSIPGFASADEERRELRAYESIIAASSGVFTDMGLNRVLMGVNPSFSPLPLASAYGATIAASSAVLALQARERNGLGDQIEVPLASAVMEGLCYNSIRIENLPDRYLTQREREIARRRIEGLPMNVSYEELQELLDPFYRSYLCKDGRMFYVVCPSHKNHAKRCLQTLGIYDELIAEGLSEEDDTYKPSAEWSSDVSLGVYPLPKVWADRIAARMKEVFITRTAKEWERIFGRNKFPGAPQRWLQEWINDDHAETSGLMIDVDDPEFGTMIQPGPVAWLEESGEAALSPAPRRWVDFNAALHAFKRIRTKLPRVTDPQDRSGWLEGVRILDLCNVIAGPHSVSFLTRFGAEVIKLDPATPKYDAWNTVIFGMSHMRGKRSALIELTTPEGREVFDKLVRSVDVIVWNAPDNQIRKMGLDADTLSRVNPDAIFCKLDCFSGVRRGSRTDYVGYDDLVQATTGIMLRFGGTMSEPEEHAHVGTIDVMCGFAGTIAIGAALYQQLKVGVVGRARTSLCANSGLLQVPFCYDYTGRGLFDEPSGRYVNGYDALTRFYYTASGEWLLLSAYEADVVTLAGIPEFAGFGEVPHEEREAFLSEIFANDTSEHWIETLRSHDIAAAVCENIDALRAKYTHEPVGTPGIDRGSYSFTVFADHPSGHVVTQLDAFGVRPERGRVILPEPAEKYGASTRQVLRDLGYDDARIDEMIAAAAVSESWSKEYLPS